MSESKQPMENAKAFVSNAFSLLSSGSTSASSGGSTGANAKAAEKSPEDIPKDDLVHLCMKMNKRMQAMEAKGQELIKKKNALANEKKIFMDFIKAIPLHIHVQEDQEITVELLDDGWKHHLSQQKEYINNIESKLAIAEYSLTQVEAKHRQEILLLQSQMATMVASSTTSSLTSSSTSSSASSATTTAGHDGEVANGTVTEGVNVPQSPMSSSSSASVVSSLQGEIERLNREKQIVEATALELQAKSRKLEMEIDSKKLLETNLRSNIQSLEESLKSKNAKLEDVQKLLDSSKAQFEERLLYLQMQQNSWKQKEEIIVKDNLETKKHLENLTQQYAALQLKLEEKDVVSKSGREVSQALQAKLVESETELAEKVKHIKELERMLSLSNQQIKEKDDALVNSKKDIKLVADSLDESMKRVKDLEEYRIKTEGLMIKLATQTDQINHLTSELEDKTSLATRLRTEAQANERNHAMRTAMLATCEAQLESLNKELIAKNDTLSEITSRITDLQSRLAASETRLQERIAESTARIEEQERMLLEQKQKYENELIAAKATAEENLENAKKEFAKKSNLARSLISEKEEENRLLVAKVQDLQTEIASGAPTERKIFEFAQAQARRDNQKEVHSDTREIVFGKIQSTLAERDLDYAKLQQMHNETIQEIAELKRIARRETVNMDYLKNIILQYMTFPISSLERMSLIPVISTLLQFNPKEMIEVEKASKDPNWNSRPVKEIKRSLHRASNPGLSSSSHGSTHG